MQTHTKRTESVRKSFAKCPASARGTERSRKRRPNGKGSARPLRRLDANEWQAGHARRAQPMRVFPP